MQISGISFFRQQKLWLLVLCCIFILLVSYGCRKYYYPTTFTYEYYPLSADVYANCPYTGTDTLKFLTIKDSIIQDTILLYGQGRKYGFDIDYIDYEDDIKVQYFNVTYLDSSGKKLIEHRATDYADYWDDVEEKYIFSTLIGEWDIAPLRGIVYPIKDTAFNGVHYSNLLGIKNEFWYSKTKGIIRAVNPKSKVIWQRIE